MFLWILIVLSSYKYNIVNLVELADISFHSPKTIILETGYNFEIMHKLKCFYNQNAPFSQYKEKDFDGAAILDMKCTVDDLEKSAKQREGDFSRIVPTYKDPFQKIKYTLDFLKKSKVITEKFPSIKLALDPFYGQFDQLINEASLSTTAYTRALLDNNALKENGKSMKTQIQKAKIFQQSMTDLFSSVKIALEVCSGSIRKDIAIYQKIISTEIIKDKLKGYIVGIKEQNDRINNACAEFKRVPKINPIIENTLTKYNLLVGGLSKIHTDVEKNINILEGKLDEYTKWIKLIRIIGPEYYEGKLKNSKNLLKSNNRDKQLNNFQRKLEVVEKLIEKMLPQINLFSLENQNLLQTSISKLKNQLLNKNKISQGKLENLRISVEEIESKIPEILKKRENIIGMANIDKILIELANSVLRSIKEIIHNKYIKKLEIIDNLSRLSANSKRYTLEGNSKAIKDYIILVDDIETSVKSLNVKQNELSSEINSFSKDLFSISKKLIVEFNSRKPKSVPKIEALEGADEINFQSSTTTPANGIDPDKNLDDLDAEKKVAISKNTIIGIVSAVVGILIVCVFVFVVVSRKVRLRNIYL